MIGRKIGTYEIRSFIGGGGMGKVYCAYDAALDRNVAIKVLSQELASHEENVLRFYREARAAAALSHPNVVIIHDIGEDQGEHYFVMEFLEGETAESMIGRCSRLDVEDALQITAQVCRAVQASHSRDLLHRDIKPQNVMILPEGTVKVLDFGIARASGGSTLTKVGETLGTVGYMAPEQILGEEVSERSDIYSIGVLLYEMLTGTLPFTGSTPVSVVYQQLEEEPVAPGVLNSSVPMAVEQIVLRALSREAEDRYGSAGEMLRDIERFLQKIPPERAPSQEETPDEEEIGGRREFHARLVGRGRELGRLRAAFDSLAEEGRGCTVLLSGEAGIGKTRLATDLIAYVRRQNGVALTGTCLYGYREGSEPYLPFIEAISRYFDATRGQVEDERRERIKRFIGEELPELRALTGRLGTTIGFDRTVDSGSKTRLFEALSQLLVVLAEEAPLVLFLDDVHWADTATLELIHYAARNTSSHPLMILAAFRPEDLIPEEEEKVHPLTDTMQRMSREGLYEAIELSGLSLEDLGTMLRSVFRRSAFSPEFRSSLHQETGGNPFFILEVLKLLKDQDVIFERNGTWREKREITRSDVPSRVYDVVIRRISRLSEGDRELLQTAAVQGDRFDSNTLSELLGMNRIEVLRVLGRLERVHQVVRSEPDGYAFSHTKIREVLYDEMASELRRAYHLALGEHLEGKDGDRPERIASLLAHHFYLGAAFDRALPYLRSAGEKATELYAHRQACRYYTQALESLEKARGIGDKDRLRKELLYLLGVSYRDLGDRKNALVVIERSMRLARDMGDGKAYAETLLQMGFIQLKKGELEAALRYYQDSLKEYEAIGDLRGQCRVLNDMGTVYHERSEWEKVFTCYRQAHEIAREIGDQEQMADVLMNLGILFQVRGQFQEATTHYDRCIRTYRELGDRRGLARAFHNVGMLYADLKDWQNARKFYDRCLKTATRIRDLPLLASTYLNVVETFLGLSDLKNARRSCVRGLELFGKLDDRLGIADACKMLGTISAQEGDWEGAVTCFDRSLGLNHAARCTLGVAETTREYGIMLREKGDLEAALSRLREAGSLFEEIGAEEDLKQVNRLIAEVVDAGRPSGQGEATDFVAT